MPIPKCVLQTTTLAFSPITRNPEFTNGQRLTKYLISGSFRSHANCSRPLGGITALIPLSVPISVVLTPPEEMRNWADADKVGAQCRATWRNGFAAATARRGCTETATSRIAIGRLFAAARKSAIGPLQRCTLRTTFAEKPYLLRPTRRFSPLSDSRWFCKAY